eukprot:Nk52_evm10s372 gene=Nk52_evmTU10s372
MAEVRGRSIQEVNTSKKLEKNAENEDEVDYLEDVEKEKDIEECVLSELVLNYLTYNCYSNTAEALCASMGAPSKTASKGLECASGRDYVSGAADGNNEMCTGMEIDKVQNGQALENGFGEEQSSNFYAKFQPHFQSMDKRKLAMTLVQSGNIDEVIELCTSQFPDLLGLHEGDPFEKRHLYFQLLCLKFVELIRKKESASALFFAQGTLNPFGKESSKFLEIIQDVVALLAYEEPEKSPVASFLDFERREDVALALNRAIIIYKGASPDLNIDTLLRQLKVVMEELNGETCNKYGAWDLQNCLNTSK